MFAWHLVRDGGHDVTVVARGARLAQLQADKAILNISNHRAEVRRRVISCLGIRVPSCSWVVAPHY